MWAPRARHAWVADSVSDDTRGVRMRDVPGAREAMNRARMVCDFDGGAGVVPAIPPGGGVIVTCIVMLYASKYTGMVPVRF